MNKHEYYNGIGKVEEEKNPLKIAMEAVLRPARYAGEFLENFTKKNIL